MSSHNRRLQAELRDVMTSNSTTYKALPVDERNILHWEILLLPSKEPYNKGAFKIAIEFPPEYPFKPPKLSFVTKIYHPNVDDKGNVCLGIILPEHWKPATKAEQVLNSLTTLIDEPDLEHPLRGELADEYRSDKKKFYKNAEDYTKKFSEKRGD